MMEEYFKTCFYRFSLYLAKSILKNKPLLDLTQFTQFIAPTDYMVQSLLEASRHRDEILRLYQNLKAYYHVHNSLLPRTQSWVR
jgi:hypothetical protein